MDLNAKELIKLLLIREHYKQKDLAVELTKRTGKSYSADGLSQKIRRGTISYNEVLIILDILGYKVNIEKIEG